ncbi:MAG: recombination protein RecR [Deltaproteobacteria bacterium]|nr:recombination protein RecR [Deltaproteobacteria bacterium]
MADPLTRLVRELAKLPGVGERTATRLAFHLLRAPESYAEQLAQAILEVRQKLRQCSICCQLTEQDPCALCADARRDAQLVMVVATPQDLLAVERAGGYRGRYHVLHGLLSPLDGVGPDELRIQPLLARVAQGGVQEVILATSPNVEGDATALYLSKLLKPLGPKVTRIASGVPIGGELEYADGITLHRAIEGRREV